MLINPYGLFSSLLLTAIFLSSPPKFIQVQLTLAMVGLSGRRVANYFETEEEAFHACIYDGDYQPLRGLLLDTSTSRNLNRPIFDFGPPLHFAAFCGDLVSVEPLLGAGADTHFSGRDMVKRLWRCGNSEKKKNAHVPRPWNTPLAMAAVEEHVAIVEDLLDFWEGWSEDAKTQVLLWAAQQWHLSVVYLLMGRFTFELLRL